MSEQGQQLNNFNVDLYVYKIQVGTLTSGASSIQNVQVQNDSLFEWIMTTAYGNLNGATPPIADNSLLPVTVMIADGGTSRNLFSAPVPIPSIAGNGKQPFINPISRFFQPNATIQASFTNLSASTYDNISLMLIGKKIFNYSAFNPSALGPQG